MTVMPAKSEGIGPIAGVVIVAAVLLLGALYFWGAWLNKHEPAPPPFISDQQVL